MNTNLKRFAQTSLLIMFFYTNISAQVFNMQSLPQDYSQIKIGYLKPDLDFYNLSKLAGVFEISLNTPLSKNYNLIAVLPYERDKYEADFGYFKYDYDENGLGNIFIGLQTTNDFVDNKRSIISYGFYIPTANKKIGLVGSTSKFYESLRYTPNSFSFYFNYAYEKLIPGKYRLGFELGPNIAIPTRKGVGDPEAFVHYGIMAGAFADKFYFGMELVGFGILTEDLKNSEDRFINSITLGTSWIGNSISPQLFYKLYLNKEMKRLVNGVFGIELSFSINAKNENNIDD
jgi:hypothetical protein